ncbi:MAG TPA: phosphate ABC transporter substrate-binding protein [bacterium (Candidatus Stahlbacteria)]|nr:phosphate ABC transporter substrate-binding protein [Candidatus Stahlbacteria bacterium]
MFKNILIFTIIIIDAILIAGCREKMEKLSIQGSTTVLPIAQKAAEDFMKEHPETQITVRGGGSGVGITALLAGTIDIAISSRAMKETELQEAEARGIKPKAWVIAKDGIAVIVHPRNTVSELSLAQLKAIYLGDIKAWDEVVPKEFTWKSGSIVVISRDVASGTFEIFKEKVLEGEKLREDALMLASNKAVSTTVAKTEGSIGYIGLGYLSSDVKALKIDGIAPLRETVLSGEYKLARPLYMYTNGEPKGLAKQFLAFVLGPKGQRIVNEQGFISIK